MIFQDKMVLNESTIPDLLSGPVNIKWKEGAPAPVATVAHTAVLFNGSVYVGGGVCDYGGDDDDDDDEEAGDNDDLCRINIYHLETNNWGDAIDTPHAAFAMTVLVNKLIIVGGAIKGSSEATNKLLTLQDEEWEDYSQMPTARGFASATNHQSMMIVIGGMNSENQILTTTELLDSTTGQWFKCNDLPQPLICSQLVIVNDMLYTLGGRTTDDYFSKAVYAATLGALTNYQLEWQQLKDTPWHGSAAVSLSNKYLLAVGGRAELDSVCILRRKKAGSVITSKSWESIGTLPKVHGGTSAVSLGNQIIVIGGIDEEDDYQRTVTIGTFQLTV